MRRDCHGVNESDASERRYSEMRKDTDARGQTGVDANNWQLTSNKDDSQ